MGGGGVGEGLDGGTGGKRRNRKLAMPTLNGGSAPLIAVVMMMPSVG